MTAQADSQTDPGLPIQAADLTAPVRLALDSPHATVLDSSVEVLHGGYGAATGGVFRIAGHAAIPDGAGSRPWSIVLKVLRAAATGRANEDPTAMGYWRREPLVYRSGLLDQLSRGGSGLSAPRCFGVETRGDEEWLWLEALSDVGDNDSDGERAPNLGPGRWPLSRYAVVAHDLGTAQAAYLLDTPLPDAPWLCREKLRTWSGMPAGGIKRLAESAPDDPVRRFWPGDRCERLLHLWAERERFLGALDSLPQTVTHGDFKRDNLFTRRGVTPESPQTVAIDWSTCGIGPVGSDTATLVTMSAIKPNGPALGELRELDALVFDAYAAGLRAAGWRDDLRPIRLAQSLAVAMEAGFLVHAAMPANDATRARRERTFGLPHDEFLERTSQLSAFGLDVADGVRPLM
jgi:hypothetical protein